MACKAEPDALHWLAYAFEGNLLALAGEIEKLSLLALPQPLTLAALQQQVQPHHHFNPFQLFDPLLQGKIKRACRILLQLRQEGVEAGMLCHLLARELDQLQQLQLGLQAWPVLPPGCRRPACLVQPAAAAAGRPGAAAAVQAASAAGHAGRRRPGRGRLR
jgi:hypothetical protein